MQADQILSITDPKILFPGDGKAVERAFRQLAKAWHPDVNHDPKAVSVFAHITCLRERAGQAKSRPATVFVAKDGRRFAFKELSRRAMDGGEVLVGKRLVAYRLDNGLLGRDPGMRFSDERMRKEMERFLPRKDVVLDLVDGRLEMFVRTPDQFLLSDMIARIGVMEPKQVAWMISGMLNVVAYLAHNGMVHGGIGPDVLLASPKHHSIALTGPMLFATKAGARPKILPERTLDVVPRMAAAGQLAEPGMDLQLVRVTALDCLGARSPAQAYAIPGLPKQVADWLASPPAASAVDDYASWERARDSGFGPRKFVPWDVPPERIYSL